MTCHNLQEKNWYYFLAISKISMLFNYYCQKFILILSQIPTKTIKKILQLYGARRSAGAAKGGREWSDSARVRQGRVHVCGQGLELAHPKLHRQKTRLQLERRPVHEGESQRYIRQLFSFSEYLD